MQAASSKKGASGAVSAGLTRFSRQNAPAQALDAGRWVVSGGLDRVFASLNPGSLLRLVCEERVARGLVRAGFNEPGHEFHGNQWTGEIHTTESQGSNGSVWVKHRAHGPSGKVIGELETKFNPQLNEHQVREVRVEETHRGKGIGVALYKSAFAHAEKTGALVRSDAATAPDADRVWQSMKRRGYNVERHPGAKLEHGKFKVFETKSYGGHNYSVPTDEPMWRLKSHGKGSVSASAGNFGHAGRPGQVGGSGPAHMQVADHYLRDSHWLNSSLRNKKEPLTDVHRESVAILDSLIDNSEPISGVKFLYRAVANGYFTWTGDGRNIEIGELNVGDEWPQPGYTSTTTKRSIAQNPGYVHPNDRLTLKISNVNGLKALNVSALMKSHHDPRATALADMEQEFVLPRGVVFKVLSHDVAKRQMDVEVVHGVAKARDAVQHDRVFARRTGDSAVSVKAILRDSSGHVLLLRDARTGNWDLPGGHKHAGETDEETLRREVREETGLSLSTTSPTSRRGENGSIIYNATVQGNAPSVALSSEHTDFKWEANGGRAHHDAAFWTGGFQEHEKVRDAAERMMSKAVSRVVALAEADVLSDRHKDYFVEAALVVLATAAMAAYAKAAHKAATLARGEDWSDVTTRAEEEAYGKARQELLRGFVGDVRDRVELEAKRGRELGESATEIHRRVEQAGREVEDGQGAVVAQTEAASVLGAAQVRAMKRAGFASHFWVALDDACEACQENEARGEVRVGAKFPSGDSSPPAHPSCRCVLHGGSRE